MYAITTTLDASADEKTRSLWRFLECDCHLEGIRLTPWPHFSWLGAQEAVNEVDIRQQLRQLATSFEPFTVQTVGFGVFTGTAPVLYLPIIKNRRLLEVHEIVWNAVLPFLKGENLYYAPHGWMPHVTLAFRDLEAHRLACAVEQLIAMPLEFVITVNHFEFAFYDGESLIGVERYWFKGEHL
jgi:hypothetical protein